MSQEIMARWQGFVTKVTGRLTEIMNESNAGFEGLLTDPQLDPITFVNAMNAIDIRYKDLYGKLGETYSQQIVTPLLGRVGEAEALLRQSEVWMEDTFSAFRTSWNLRLVQSLWARVQPLMQKPVACTRCGATIENRTVYHRADSVTCKHCGSVNSITPDPLVYTYYAMAPDMVAEQSVITKWLACERSIRRGASKSDRVGMWHAYWTEYVTTRATMIPMSDDEKKAYVESRVDQIRRYG